jgi:hypothetical protein
MKSGPGMHPLFALLPLTASFALLPFLTPFFPVNDDVLMLLTAKGIGLVDHPDPNLLHPHPLLGAVLALFYRLWSGIPWYPLFLFLLAGLIWTALGWLLAQDPHPRARVLLLSALSIGGGLHFLAAPPTPPSPF